METLSTLASNLWGPAVPQLESAIDNRGDIVLALDSAARYFLMMSGEEFVDRWYGGFFHDPDAVPGVMEVASLLPREE